MIQINIKDDKIKHIIELENKYRNNNYNGVKNGNSNFKIIQGRIPILLSAPHAVNQYRNGAIKGADLLTGAIAEYLCEITGTNGIIRTCNFKDDPNFENEGVSLEYKKAILRIVKERGVPILIDIHGCKNNHGFDIELGTNYGKNTNQDETYIDICRGEFSKIGKVVIDNRFKASGSATISNYINKNSGIQCIQIEIASGFRNDSNKLLELLNGFERIIDKTKIVGSIDRNDEISR